LLVFAGLVFVISTDGLSQFGARPTGDRLAEFEKSAQFDGEKFVNQYPINMTFSFADYRKMFSRWFEGGRNHKPGRAIDIINLNNDSFASPPVEDIRVTWLGHSTVLLEIDGFRLLTDPVWSQRCSPISFMGPTRFHPVPIALEDLPPLDAVIISHDHYDHLDKDAVRALAKTGVTFYMPLGVGADFEKWDIDSSQIREMDWWDTEVIKDDLKLVAIPARHFSGRGLFNSGNLTLWASFVIVGPKHRVYFSGDTGEYPNMAEIGQKFGPFDLTLMKIGAYGDMWPNIHLTPEQAVRVHRTIDGNVFMPIHWGTFKLAFHGWDEPAERLCKAADK
ncbi:MAG: hypothetical protein GY841_24260, partial [FCB group bacterium]|nr:hypothetical protein [FCB group bacterium]